MIEISTEHYAAGARAFAREVPNLEPQVRAWLEQLYAYRSSFSIVPWVSAQGVQERILDVVGVRWPSDAQPYGGEVKVYVEDQERPGNPVSLPASGGARAFMFQWVSPPAAPPVALWRLAVIMASRGLLEPKSELPGARPRLVLPGDGDRR